MLALVSKITNLQTDLNYIFVNDGRAREKKRDSKKQRYEEKTVNMFCNHSIT